jgi:hypothetical protein
MKGSVLIAAGLLLLAGCAAGQPQLMMETGASLSGYKTITVAAVSNATGQTFNFDFASAFAEDLRSALRSKGYDVSDPNASSPNALIVQCSIMNYAPGNTPKQIFTLVSLPFTWGLTFGSDPSSKAGVKTLVMDRRTGQALAHMVTIKQVDPWFGGYRSILQSVATDIATAIDDRIKGT